MSGNPDKLVGYRRKRGKPRRRSIDWNIHPKNSPTSSNDSKKANDLEVAPTMDLAARWIVSITTLSLLFRHSHTHLTQRPTNSSGENQLRDKLTPLSHNSS